MFIRIRRRQSICRTQNAMDGPSTVSHVMGVHSTPVTADAGGGRLTDQAPGVRCLPERLDAPWEAWVQAYLDRALAEVEEDLSRRGDRPD